MVTRSYNGWTASKNPRDFGGLDNRPIPGTNVRYAPGIRAGHVALIAFWWGWQWNTKIEPVISPGCWGYYFKNSANSKSLLSCHSGGTAWDINAPQHPNGVRGTMRKPSLIPGKTKEQVLREMMAYLEGVVYSGMDAWGGGTPDDMHAEIDDGASEADVARVAAKILRDFGPMETWIAGRSPNPVPAPPTPAAPPPANVTASAEVRTDQLNLTDTGFPCVADGVWGPDSIQQCKNFQAAAGLASDGICGPATRAKLKMVPSWRGHPVSDGGYSALRWQRELKNHGWRIATDGAWGAHSTSILSQFQNERRLIRRDGVRDSQAWTALHCIPN